MYSPENTARRDSIKLIVIGFIHAHPMASTQGGVPVTALHQMVMQRLAINNDEIVSVLADMKEDGEIQVVGELMALDSTMHLSPKSLLAAEQYSAQHLPEKTLPFHRFAQLASRGLLNEYGIAHDMSARFFTHPYPQPPAYPKNNAQVPPGGYRMTSGYAQPRGPGWTPPFGQQMGMSSFYPHQPIGSERETYSDEPSLAVDAPVVNRTTVIKGVEMLPDDVKLLVWKLQILVSALSSVPPLNDKDFMVTATFKGLEFTMAEAMEVLRILE
jgi:hypothetical protein